MFQGGNNTQVRCLAHVPCSINGRDYSVLQERRLIHLIGSFHKLCAFSVIPWLWPHHSPWGSQHHPHLAGEASGSRRWWDLPRATRCVNGRMFDHSRARVALLKVGLAALLLRERTINTSAGRMLERALMWAQRFWEKEIGKAHCQQSEGGQQEKNVLRRHLFKYLLWNRADFPRQTKSKIHVIIDACNPAIFRICGQYLFLSKEKRHRHHYSHVSKLNNLSPLLLCCSHQHNVLWWILRVGQPMYP